MKVRIEAWRCSHCRHIVNGAQAVGPDKSAPNEGDYTLCLYCAELHVWHGGHFVALTDDELIDMPLDHKQGLAVLQHEIRELHKQRKAMRRD